MRAAGLLLAHPRRALRDTFQLWLALNRGDVYLLPPKIGLRAFPLFASKIVHTTRSDSGRKPVPVKYLAPRNKILWVPALPRMSQLDTHLSFLTLNDREALRPRLYVLLDAFFSLCLLFPPHSLFLFRSFARFLQSKPSHVSSPACRSLSYPGSSYCNPILLHRSALLGRRIRRLARP